MPPLILSHILWWSKPEFDSTTHVDRKMTFWFSISTLKIRKKSNTFEQYSNFIHHSNRLWETNNMRYIKHWNSKMSNFGEIIFYSPIYFMHWFLFLNLISICLRSHALLQVLRQKVSNRFFVMMCSDPCQMKEIARLLIR